MSAAQLDRLRKSKSFMTTPPAETPMVEIPAGEFMMGSDGTQALEDERPSHRVWLDAFSIDLHEVTTAQYAAFLSADKTARLHGSGNPLISSSTGIVPLSAWTGATPRPSAHGRASGFPQKPSGKKRREGPTLGCIHGAIKRRPELWRILRWVRASATTRSCFPCVRTSQGRVPMGSITWPAMPTNGCKTGTEPTTTTPLQTGIHPDRARASSRSCVAAPGRICPSIC